MIINRVQCDICKQTSPVVDMQIPLGWIQVLGTSHFCSVDCLGAWIIQMHPGRIPSDPVQLPVSTIRRFLLIDGDTADEIECVKWSNGFVSLDAGSDHVHDHCTVYYYPSWDVFKDAHPGSGITWIDQEVNNATNS